MNTHSRIALLALALTGLAMTACQSGYRQHAKAVTSAYAAGDYHGSAAKAASGEQARQQDKTERVIYRLEAARTAQVAGDPAASVIYYEAVQEDIRPYLDSEAEATVSEAMATTAVNQAMRTYRSTPVERIMVSSLNAANYMALGNPDAARIELNRAREWQQDAVAKHQKAIDARQKALETDGSKNKIETSDELPDNMKRYYGQLDDMSGYADFRNPFADHLRAVFLMSNFVDDGDLVTARSDLRTTLSSSPGAEPALREDLLLLENSQRKALPPTTWIYFLTGRAPHLEELQITIPIPVREVPTATAAFPLLKFNDDYMTYLEVKTTEGDPVRSVELIDLDSAVGSEFKTRLPTIVAQEILSATAKAAATYGMTKGMGDYGTVLGTIYQTGSAEADLRSWRTMPKEIQLCRVPTPADGVISLAGPGGRSLGAVQVAPGENNVVFVTIPSRWAAAPSIMAAQLTGTLKPTLPSTADASQLK